ncbi:MAG: DUF4349 domain-containing protein [Oscillospiraceae bacterium]|nr:DUF4349 domain-containing protein [Oscillospiraceae bacterium]
MKKRISIILVVALAVALLSACAGGADSSSGNYFALSGGGTTAPAAAPPMAEMVMSDSIAMYAMDDAEMYTDLGRDYGGSAAGGGSDGGNVTPITAPVTEGLAEKIIYSVFADIETLNFDETIENVHTMLLMYGAFIEHSSISGVNYASRFHGWDDFRYASFTIRVPVLSLNAMTGQLRVLGNVVHESSRADNITAQFVDTQSRLNSLIIQEERLLNMLSQADDIPDLIAIEERLSDVRYQIEWLTTTLNNWQRQVDFSTMTLTIREVEEYTEQPQFNPSYWEQIRDGFISSLRGIGRFFMNLFLWLIVSAPVLIVLAAVAIIALIIIRRKMRAYAKKRANMPPKATAYPTAPMYPAAPAYPATPTYPTAPAYPASPANTPVETLSQQPTPESLPNEQVDSEQTGKAE